MNLEERVGVIYLYQDIENGLLVIKGMKAGNVSF
jgi:hypothetical protein